MSESERLCGESGKVQIREHGFDLSLVMVDDGTGRTFAVSKSCLADLQIAAAQFQELARQRDAELLEREGNWRVVERGAYHELVRLLPQSRESILCYPPELESLYTLLKRRIEKEGK